MLRLRRAPRAADTGTSAVSLTRPATLAARAPQVEEHMEHRANASPKEGGIPRRAFLEKAAGLGIAAKAIEIGIVPLRALAAPARQEDVPVALATRELIGPNDRFPITFANIESSNFRDPIFDGIVRARAPIEITGTITFRPTERTPAGSFAGIMLTNLQPDHNANNPRESTLLLRRNVDGTLLLHHRHAGREGETFPIGRIDDVLDFTMQIAEDGRSVRVDTSAGSAEVILQESLFARDDNLRLMVTTNSFAETEVSRLSVAQPPLEQSPYPEGDSLRVLAKRKNISIGSSHLIDKPVYDEREELIAADQLNHIALVGQLGWNFIQKNRGQGPLDFSRPDQVVNFAIRNGQEVTGQHLIWGDIDPRWLTEGNFSREQALKIMEDRVSSLMDRYSGIISQWIVVNEAVADQGGGLKDNFWLRNIGPEYIELAFRAARRTVLDATLLYNDFAYEGGNRKADKIFEVVKDLKAKGLIDGIGMQMHLKLKEMPSINDIRATMKRFKDLGLQVFITELDVNIVDATGSKEERLQEQAGVFASVFNLAFEMGLPRVTLLGIEDTTSWLLARGGESPHLFNGYQPKPSFFALQKALA